MSVFIRRLFSSLPHRGEIIRVSIDGMNPELLGVTELPVFPGYPVSIHGSIPGEVVEAKFISRSKGANVVKIVEKSPFRVEPKCKHVDKCRMCTMQHITIEQQVNMKQDLVLDELKLIADVVPLNVLEPIYCKDSYETRRKLKFLINPGRLGDNSEFIVGSRNKLDPSESFQIQECPVIPRRGNQLLKPLSDCLKTLECFLKLKVAVFNFSSESNVSITIDFVEDFSLDQISRTDLFALERFSKQFNCCVCFTPGKQLNEIISVVDSQLNNSISTCIIETKIPKAESKIRYGPKDFLFNNLKLTSEFVQAILSALNVQKNDIIYDVHCGVGSVTIPISRALDPCFQNSCSQESISSCSSLKKSGCGSGFVFGLDAEPECISRAEKNAVDNNILSRLIKFSYAALDSHFIPETENPNKIVIHRRNGKSVSELFVSKLMYQVSTVIYVCDDYKAAAMDTVILSKLGFSIKSLQVIDSTPHSPNFDVIIVFSR